LRHNVECTHRAQPLSRLSRWPIAHPSTNNGVDTNVWTDKTRMGELRRMTAFKLSWLMGGIAPLPLIKSAHGGGQAMASAEREPITGSGDIAIVTIKGE